MRDQRSCNPATSHVWVDKQGIEFAFPVSSRFHRGKSDNLSSPWGHEYATCGDLRDRQLDGVRVGQQRVTITGLVWDARRGKYSSSLFSEIAARRIKRPSKSVMPRA